MEIISNQQQNGNAQTSPPQQRHSHDLTLKEEPVWAMQIRRRYGDFKTICMAFQPSKVVAICANPIKAVSENAPSLARLNVTYGTGAARQWLYLIIQASVKMLGVDSTRMSDEQIVHLADIISGTYPYLTMTEFLLFISRFEAGMYERFYGDASYFLAVTKSLASFMAERNIWIEQVEIERKRKRQEEQDNRKNAVTYSEYVKSRKYLDKADIKRQAEAIITHNRLIPNLAEEVNKAFKANYGKTPEEYIEKSKDNDKD